MRSDADIKRDVEEELRWDPSLDATDIAVTVADGVVTLAGFARSYADKWRAEEVATRVVGVRGVANDIEVRLPGSDQRPDPEIARDAVKQIQIHLPTLADDIKVVVKNGWVTLEGQVEWRYQRDMAESAVRWLKGVRGVTNLLMLKPKTTPVDLQKQIEEAFRRNAELDARRITVENVDGTIILRGTVRSWAERQEAERVAWSAPGVTKVENHIVVSP